jgi:ABC-type transport system substrate-binding protein
MLEKKLKRREFLKWTAMASAGAILAACTPATANPTSTNPPMPGPATYTPPPAPVANKNAWGVTLPADAAPVSQQFLRAMTMEGTCVDFDVSVYKRLSNAYTDRLSVPLVQINKNFEIVNAGADSFSSNADGTVWTIKLDPNLKWSDGNPVTADDHVFTFQYCADPKHAWDFAWFWGDIAGFNDAVAGKIPTTQIGVTAVDATTLQITTTAASPYLPSKLLYARPLSKAAFTKSGELYNNDPTTSVSSSPWILSDWTKGKQQIISPNKSYSGKDHPFLETTKVIFTGDTSTMFASYQNNEIDVCDTFSPANITTISNDKNLNAQYHPGYGDFRTYYLTFETDVKPFSDLKVRQAFAKAIDRDSIIKNIVGRQGIPAYSFLMPGFPDSTSTDLKNEDVNKFDVAAAQKLLADAGYAGGAGFPAQEMWLRQENQFNQSIAQAIAAMLTQNLGIQVTVSNKETKLFTDAMNSHKLPFFFISYGFDYLDPSNMLGIWVTGGRHTWTNPQFDQLVKDASSLVGNQTKRDQEFKDSEKILVDDVGGVFIYHVTPGQIYQPYFVGEELQPDKTGVAAFHWPSLEDCGAASATVYIANTVPSTRTL